MITGNYTLQFTAQSPGGNGFYSISARDPQRINLSGSRLVDTDVTVTGSAWVSLMTASINGNGSISDYRYFEIYNRYTGSNASGSIIIAASQSNQTMRVADLGPKDSTFISPVAGTTYFARISGSVGLGSVILRVSGAERV